MALGGTEKFQVGASTQLGYAAVLQDAVYVINQGLLDDVVSQTAGIYGSGNQRAGAGMAALVTTSSKSLEDFLFVQLWDLQGYRFFC